MKTAFLLSVMLSLSCVQQVQVTKIGNDELIKLMEDPDVQLVDVRTTREVNKGMIEGAVHINFYDDDFEENIKKLDVDKPIVLYCAAGGRSAGAGERITGWGFTKIYDLTGGFGLWKSEGRPVVTPKF